jgi:membrane protease YdiL (CAAX protease family)
MTMRGMAAWIALAAYLAFAFRWWRDVLARVSRRLGEATVLLVLLPYLLAADLRPALFDLLRVVAYVAVPTFLLHVRPRDARPFDVWHVLAVLAIWVPIELDLFVLLLDLALPGVHVASLAVGVALIPKSVARLVPGVDLPVHTLTAVLLTLWLFLVRHPLPGIGLSLRFCWADVRCALLGLLGFAAVGLPAGLAMGFLRAGLTVPRPAELVVRVLGGYLLVALPEEVLFRGVIQNLAERRWQRGVLVLPFAAAIFGLAHLNNGTPGYPAPNWAYVGMAMLAGLAYGWVWRRTKKVTLSALTHALVNLMWGMLFG